MSHFFLYSSACDIVSGAFALVSHPSSIFVTFWRYFAWMCTTILTKKLWKYNFYILLLFFFNWSLFKNKSVKNANFIGCSTFCQKVINIRAWKWVCMHFYATFRCVWKIVPVGRIFARVLGQIGPNYLIYRVSSIFLTSLHCNDTELVL